MMNFKLIVEIFILIIFSVLTFNYDRKEDRDDDEISRKEEIIITIISVVLSIFLVHFFF